MSRKEQPGTSKPSPMASLSRIVSRLDQARLTGEKLEEALGHLGIAVGAGAVAIYRKWYDDSDIFSLERLALWAGKSTAADVLPETIASRDIAPQLWDRLRNREIVRIDLNPQNAPAGKAQIRTLPVRHKGKMFGFIALTGLDAGSLTSAAREFLEAICPIFEMWVSKMNLKKRLNDVIEFLPNATIGINDKGIATVWNPAVEKMTGWSADRIIGKGNYEYALPFYDIRRPLICDLILKPDPAWEDTYLEYRKEGEVVHSLIFTPAVTGGGVFLTGSTKKMHDVNGYAYGSLHIVQDITRERQIESKLHSSESMFQTIADYAGLGIALFQKEKALYYNERFEELLGISGREIALQDLKQMVHSEDRKELSGHLDKMFQGRGKKTLRQDLRAQQAGNHRDYSAYTQVFEFEGKRTICFVLDDITEQKAMARRARLNELKLYHEGRLTSLGIMAAGIAHELNQPLNTIRVVTDGFLFGRDKGWELDPDELYEGLEMTSRQVLRMSGVIQNVRNFAREDRGQVSRDVDVNQAVDNVFSMIGRQLEAHNIDVQKNLDKNVPRIKTELNRLEQVIMNLVVNARQALDASSRDAKKLWVKTGMQKKFVQIEVGDNALGIPADLTGKIFDPFFTTKDVGQGTGLGLTISQSIVAEFKGQLKVFNNESGGATFIVSAPAAGGPP